MQEHYNDSTTAAAHSGAESGLMVAASAVGAALVILLVYYCTCVRQVCNKARTDSMHRVSGHRRSTNSPRTPLRLGDWRDSVEAKYV
jgi:hypothetical protein